MISFRPLKKVKLKWKVDFNVYLIVMNYDEK